jgi:hypothetical protein
MANQPVLTPEQVGRVVPPAASPSKSNGTNGTVKIPATESDWMAVQLHVALDDQNALRKRLLQKEQELVSVRVAISQLEARILELETAAAEAAMVRLRRERNMSLNRRISKDEVTGEVYWVDGSTPPVEAPASPGSHPPELQPNG